MCTVVEHLIKNERKDCLFLLIFMFITDIGFTHLNTVKSNHIKFTKKKAIKLRRKNRTVYLSKYFVRDFKEFISKLGELSFINKTVIDLKKIISIYKLKSDRYNNYGNFLGLNKAFIYFDDIEPFLDYTSKVNTNIGRKKYDDLDIELIGEKSNTYMYRIFLRHYIYRKT